MSSIHDNAALWTELVERRAACRFQFSCAAQDLDLSVARDKSVAVKRLVPIIREVGDPVQRAHYAQRLARLVQVSEQTVNQQLTTTKRGHAAAEIEMPTAATAPTRLEEYCLRWHCTRPTAFRTLRSWELEDLRRRSTVRSYRRAAVGQRAELSIETSCEVKWTRRCCHCLSVA